MRALEGCSDDENSRAELSVWYRGMRSHIVRRALVIGNHEGA